MIEIEEKFFIFVSKYISSLCTLNLVHSVYQPGYMFVLNSFHSHSIKKNKTHGAK